METVKQALAKMSDRELASYWNILQMSRVMLQNDEARNQMHEAIVSDLLKSRGVRHEAGKLLK